MAWLIVGLVLFLGAHSLRVFADGWRAGMIARLGEGPWKGLYTLVSLAGLGLIVWGYGRARGAAPLYALPAGLAHLTALLVLLGFICLVAAYWPGNHIKRALRDPMVFGVGLWALGHLLANAAPAALALFGGFLAWAILDYASLRRRAGGIAAPAASVGNTIGVVVVGTVLAGVFAMVLHLRLIGVAPMG